MNVPKDGRGPSGEGSVAESRDAVPSSVRKAFALIEELVTAPAPVRLHELARATGMTKPTTHRLLRALYAIGYVRPVGSGQYAVGPGLISVAAATLGGLKERPLVHRTLTQLHERTGLTASYAMRWGDSVVVIDNVEPDQAYRVSPRLGVRTPLTDSAAGLAILATAAPGDRDDEIPPASLAAVDAARGDGYAVDTSQAGVCAVAAPVRIGGPLAGALMVTGLSFGMSPDSVRVIGPLVAEQANALAATVRATIPAVSDIEEDTA
ncbi:IclR family transcriptional regulator [Spiractinospora alimapuensis]|uniref:IclR family transcriptional regulator n=1 Tax=Spiractinospora alimapuensis TaxID=2820884 RepID=UPI001F15CE42|nr:IclR family transcriptional regulator [Spiractinospora alimapuensis]QVQ52769.1 IclR family transcriptional regulator [Spiractinospora alimapuensis]